MVEAGLDSILIGPGHEKKGIGHTTTVTQTGPTLACGEGTFLEWSVKNGKTRQMIYFGGLTM
jgi:hypothetical protein